MSRFEYVGFGKNIVNKRLINFNEKRKQVAKITSSSYTEKPSSMYTLSKPKQTKIVGFGRQPIKYHYRRRTDDSMIRTTMDDTDNIELKNKPCLIVSKLFNKPKGPINIGFGRQPNKQTMTTRRVQQPTSHIRVFEQDKPKRYNYGKSQIAFGRQPQKYNRKPKRRIERQRVYRSFPPIVDGEGEACSCDDCGDCVCIDGNLIGNVCGDVYGDVYGNVFGTLCGDIITDFIQSKNDGNIRIVANIEQQGDICPTTDKQFNLGCPDKKWAKLYTEDLIVCGDTDLGDNLNEDTVTFTAKVDSHILPSITKMFDLGSPSLKWRNVYTQNLIVCDDVHVTDKIVANCITSNVFIGNVIGNICGTFKGEILGNIQGNITGDVTGNVCGNLKGDVFGNVCGDIITDNITFKNDGNIHVIADIEQTGNIVPTENNNFYLGSLDLKWKHIFTQDLTVCDTANVTETITSNVVNANLVCSPVIQVDYINEKTNNHGVVVDRVLHKDNMVVADKITANTKVVTDLLEAQDNGTIKVDGNLVPLINDKFTLGTIVMKWKEVFTNDLTVCQNATINGNLTILGNSTIVGTETTVIDDPCLVVNNNPNMSHNAAYMMQRFQTENDTLYGDVIDGPSLQTSNVVASASGNVTLDGNVGSSEDDRYNDWWISIISGTGVNQVRQIIDYDGNTKVAVIKTAWTVLPNTTSIYKLHPCNYVGLTWDEALDKFTLSCSANGNCEAFVTETFMDFCVADVESENIVPRANITYDLGSPDKKWNNIYTEDLFVCGNSKLGDNIDGDIVTFVSKVDSHILPKANITYDLGSPTFKWNNVYTQNLVVCDDATISDKLTANCVNSTTFNGNLFGDVCGDIVTDNITFKNDGNIHIFANINQKGHIVPTIDKEFDLGNVDFKWANLYTQDALICGNLCVQGMIKGNIDIDVGNVSNINANTIVANVICANTIKGDFFGDLCGNIKTDLVEAKNNGNIQIFANIQQTGDIFPTINNKYDLGNIDLKWANLFVQDAYVCGDLYVTDKITANCINANVVYSELFGNVTGDLCGDIQTDFIKAKNDGNIHVVANIEQMGDIVPTIDKQYDLGTLDKKWNKIYVQDVVVCGTIQGNIEGNVVAPFVTTIHFASDQTVSSGKYLGLGNTANAFEDSAVVVPMNGKFTRITFSTKGTGISTDGATAVLYKRSAGFGNVATTTMLSATLSGGQDCAIGFGNVDVTTCDNIAVFINPDGASSMKVAVSLCLESTMASM